MRRHVDSVFDLIDYSRYREAVAQLDSSTSSTLETAILRSLIAMETGDPSEAAKQVEALLERHLSTRERVLCLLALSRAAYIFGHTSGLASLRQAVLLARSLGDATLLARAQGRLARFALHRVSVEAAMPELAALRRSAYAAADSHALTEFHCFVAEVEMKRGKYGAAAQRLRVADTLSAQTADVGMQANVSRLIANAAVLASEPHLGLPAIRRCVQLLETNGARYARVAPLTTLAHLDLLLGNLDEAESALRRALQVNTGATSQAACLEALARVDLAREDTDAAAQHLAAIDAIGPFKADEYYWLFGLPTRARWLIAKGRGNEALDLLRTHTAAALKSSDNRLAAEFVLGEIEALIATGAHDDAAEHLAQASVSLPVITLEDLARLNALASTISPNHGTSLQHRARRIEHLAFGREAQSEAEVIVPGGGEPTNAIHESATAVAVSVYPELLAREVAAVFAAASCADQLRVVHTKAGETSGTPLTGERVPLVTIEVGDGESFTIAGRPFTDVDSRLSIMSIRLLARVTADLANSQRHERLAPSIWPETLSEESFGLVVAAESMKELIEIARRVAASNATVLITGESGTGKELLARALHEASPRQRHPFIPFNCTSVTRDMFDSQLFGHRRGAFTGAHDNFAGVIRTAAGGTLLLDEVGELPLDVQPKLLRFLESGEIHPLGEPRPITVDVRVVAATNANLEQLVAEGRFREDLFYRLNVVRLHVPPLRERREEIPLLVHHFVDKFSREARKTGIRLAEETMEYLVLFKWPGNVRQLANEVRRIVALADSGAVVMPEHLAHEILSSRRTIPASDRPAAPTEFVVRMDQPLAAAMQHLERSMVRYALASAGDRLEDAAQMLGLSRKGLYLKRQRLRLDVTPPPDDEEPGEKAVEKRV
jgi:DNA-binding NtrC family response regulator/tetratricopeptide (TPR) repeat protein